MDMATPGRGIPRFLPTLTEVVQLGTPHPSQVAESMESADAVPVHSSPAPLEPPSMPSPPAAEAAADNAALLREQIEHRVRQIVAGALAAQVDRITHQVMGELEPAMRQLARETRRNGSP
jgi:hypothetical protein